MASDYNYGDGVSGQLPAILVDYENNREERLPCVLLVDGSGSMVKNDAIDELNRGLAGFAAALKRDPVASLRVQLMVIRFGGTVEKMCDWTDAENFEAPHIEARGDTPLGEALECAMRLVDEQVEVLRSQGIARKRPWIWVMSDGRPTDERWQGVAEQARNAQKDGKFFLYPVSVITDPADAAHTATLKKLSIEDKCIQIQGAEFEAFFKFVSNSSRVGSRQNVGPDVGVFQLHQLDQIRMD